MFGIREAYCSWCFERTHHVPKASSIALRTRYVCSNCGNETRKCIACAEMARGRRAVTSASEEEIAFLQKLGAAMGSPLRNKFCAEHDGTVANFTTLHQRLDELEDYEHLFKRRKMNLYHAGKIAGLSVGGAIVLGPLAYIAAPGIASALGAAGFLGAAFEFRSMQMLKHDNREYVPYRSIHGTLWLLVQVFC